MRGNEDEEEPGPGSGLGWPGELAPIAGAMTPSVTTRGKKPVDDFKDGTIGKAEDRKNLGMLPEEFPLLVHEEIGTADDAEKAARSPLARHFEVLVAQQAEGDIAGAREAAMLFHGIATNPENFHPAALKLMVIIPEITDLFRADGGEVAGVEENKHGIAPPEAGQGDHLLVVGGEGKVRSGLVEGKDFGQFRLHLLASGAQKRTLSCNKHIEVQPRNQ